MSAENRMSPKAGAASTRQLRWPFVGVAVLLIVLIILTPNLFSTGAAGLETRAQLIVERAAAGGNTSFYVESIGTSTLYRSVAVGLAPLPSWPYNGIASDVHGWSWTNGTDTLVLVATNATNPVAVNVTVKYIDPSGVSTEYVGVYGFNLNDTTLALQAVNLLPGAAAPPGSTPLADLPIFLLLAIQTASGPTQ
ncbi:MAG: hypothetical protein WA688_09965 [Thermoplasmata archaeon]